MGIELSSIENTLKETRRTWLITGAAGFIGSNILEFLLLNRQRVVGLDNFATGHASNLEDVRSGVGSELWSNFQMIEGDIRDPAVCGRVCEGVHVVLHQAALGSVPRSISDPITTNDVNVGGFLNMLDAAKNAGVQKFVYAASSSTYGDHPALPKVEDTIGNPLSPYAVSKLANELYADVFSKTYDFHSVGLRYFNVFGERQDPAGPYAAVIPKWISAMIHGDAIDINGDGLTSRDFCYVRNAVIGNVLAGLSNFDSAEVFNVAVGARTSLLELFGMLQSALGDLGISYNRDPEFREFRKGDVRHSQASTLKIQRELGYIDPLTVNEGLAAAMPWYVDKAKLRLTN